MNDNPFAVLTEESIPDSRVRIEDVITAGRSRMRRRRAAVAGVCAAIVVLATVAGIAAAVLIPHRDRDPSTPDPTPVPSVTTHPSGCTVAALDVGGDIGGTHTDPSGRYVAYFRAPDPGLLILYRDGAVVRQFTAPERLRVTAMNTAGTVIGEQGGTTAVRTTADGAVAALPKPSGALKVWANGINAAGDIVGEASMPGKKFRAVLWRHTAPASPVLLPTPAGKSSAAHAITDDGRIVGELDQGAVPYLWNADGTGAALPTPPSMPGGIPSSVTGDWAVGVVNYLSITTFDPASGRRAGAGSPYLARWHLSAGTVEPLLITGLFMGSGGITAGGTAAVNRIDGAAFWDGGALVPLPAPPGYDHVEATSISADGRVVGGAAIKSSGGSIEPFRWDCGR